MKIFERDTDIILQGPISQNYYNRSLIDTLDVANEYSKVWFVNKVIVSTWNEEPIPDKYKDNERIVIIQSEKITPHYNNMNLQLKSTKEGLKHCTSKYAVKMRSDQLIFPNSLCMMKSFVDFYVDDVNIKFTDGTSPKGYVFVHGIDANHPYLLQDHIWWGYTEDINKVFSCEYLNQHIFDLPPNGDSSYYDDKFNIPAWIGFNYMKKFDKRVEIHYQNQPEYMYKISPKRKEALAVYEELREKMFKTFPKIDMFWIKYDYKGYPYPMYMVQNHYFYEEQIEKTECKYNPQKGFSKYF
jgi:hypothetical protein